MWPLLLAALTLSPPPTSRRQLLGRAAVAAAAAAAAAAAEVPVLAAHAEPSFFSTLQGPIQDVIAPGHWVGQLAGINSKTDRWEFADSSPEEVSGALVSVLEGLTPDRRAKLLMPELRIARADASAVHVLTWTKAEWLDSLDVRLEPRGSGCVARASFYATGLVPTWIRRAIARRPATGLSAPRHQGPARQEAGAAAARARRAVMKKSLFP